MPNYVVCLDLLNWKMSNSFSFGATWMLPATMRCKNPKPHQDISQHGFPWRQGLILSSVCHICELLSVSEQSVIKSGHYLSMKITFGHIKLGGPLYRSAGLLSLLLSFLLPLPLSAQLSEIFCWINIFTSLWGREIDRTVGKRVNRGVSRMCK